MGIWDEDDGGLAQEDFYALFNLQRDATAEEIKSAYRRLCVIYHPDKHQNDNDREAAAQMFARITNAYEVLTDTNQRAVYDIYGQKGLDAGMEVVLRQASPNEIREEYERLRKIRQEEELRRRTNEKSVITVAVDATPLFDSKYSKESDSLTDKLSDVELGAISMQGTLLAPVGNDTANLTVNVSSYNGNGAGTFVGAYRHEASHGFWLQGETQVAPGWQMLTGTIGRRYSQAIFATLSGTLDCRPKGMIPGLRAMVGMEIEPNTMGYLTYKAGKSSAMSTTISKHYENGTVTCTGQLGQPMFLSCNALYRYSDDIKYRVSGSLGNNGLQLSYGCHRQVTRLNKLGVTLALSAPGGVTLSLKFKRSKTNYIVPIQIADEADGSMLWGAAVPFVAFYLLNKLLIDPYHKNQAKLRKMELQAEHAQVIRERKREAESAIRIMRESVEKKMDIEDRNKGFVVLKAWYGDLKAPLAQQVDAESPVVIDVTIPLQAMVKDSQLHLQQHSKSGLIGFYDCCMGEDKQLRVQYRFKGHLHEVTINDDEPLSCPKRSHAVRAR
ncbi:hypothetical protein SARC_00004 [Sphaeroforma arctica JP610]|uniref:J domain-containing protein n=1 Tax=Sphaeroforma arctica JP610 TaxID=667725 RepID=A0A0L0GFL2_9EUKA|nr:hypothetical protein SARC_00004 [Sphaeroforma arctica JP610]KNC87870.1 hypothetical protein SARC_00004 [Sphaeroforma arctica JP610]|eukprot:XP_014161772.1 hypothetical protein SARC_00004 [Sphaeroforma arctica JP610]